MKKLVLFFVSSFMFSFFALATPDFKCEKWKNDKCVKGPLTDLAESFYGKNAKQTVSSEGSGETDGSNETDAPADPKDPETPKEPKEPGDGEKPEQPDPEKPAEPSVCEKVCSEACPKCDFCEYCSFCSFYEEDACIGVPYFTDRDTCELKETNSCCQICDLQCYRQGGACAYGGICKGGSTGTSDMMYCVEETNNEVCKACDAGEEENGQSSEKA